ncbi:MAG: glycosyltransferase family 29 protein [Aliiglaciecola sp.]|uniref:glycosyltransferase family 29 protein n=1 Tax=Aliiglaciecola sp. TaxID=1872441 RepID=UPI003299730E
MKKMFGIEQSLFLPERVAVIGSSPSLMKKELGSEIDSFQAVFRFNGALTKGFERNVGSKSDYICLGLDLAYFSNYPFIGPVGNVITTDSPNRYQNSLILKALNIDTKFITWSHEIERASLNRQHENYLHLIACLNSEDVFTWWPEKTEQEVKDNYQGNRILEEYDIDPLLCSGKGMRTGFRTVLMLVKSGVKPSLFGFDVDENIKSARHYYDNFTSDNFDEHTAHDFRGEMAALVELRNKKLITISG